MDPACLIVLKIVLTDESPNACEEMGDYNYLNKEPQHAHYNLVLLLVEAHQKVLKNVDLKIVEIHIEFNQLQISQRNEVNVEHRIWDHSDDVNDEITLEILVENL